jgi:hypothetical protein
MLRRGPRARRLSRGRSTSRPRAPGRSRDAHGRLRRPGRDAHADARGARPGDLRPRRARRGALGRGAPRLVHDARRADPTGFDYDAGPQLSLSRLRTNDCPDRRTQTCSGAKERHATPVHGLRHRARHAVHVAGGGRRGRAAAPRPAADRRRHPLPRAVRHDGREPDAVAGGEAGASSSSWSTRRRAACRCSPAPAATTRARWSRRRARCGGGRQGLLSVTPYYNKPTPDGLSALPGDRDAATLPDHRLQRAGPHRLQRRPRDARGLATHPDVVGVKEASGNMTQICEVCARCPPTSSCCRATMR